MFCIKVKFLTKNNHNSKFIIGCLFHFSQAVWRQVQSNGLSTKYREDEYFRLNVKKLIALAFVPVDDVVTAFDLVAQQFDDDADDLIDYFEKTWIGQRKRRGMFFSIVIPFCIFNLFRRRSKEASL